MTGVKEMVKSPPPWWVVPIIIGVGFILGCLSVAKSEAEKMD